MGLSQCYMLSNLIAAPEFLSPNAINISDPAVVER